MKNLSVSVADAQIAQGNHGFWLRARKYLVCGHRLPAKKNRAVKNKSTTTTRKMDMTTARVVERPTCSAPPPVDNPSRQPTAVMVMANMTLFNQTGVIFRRKRDSTQTRAEAPKLESGLTTPER